MSRRVWLLVLVILPVLVVGSLYLRTLVRHVFFEAGQPTDASARARLTQAALESPTGASQSVVLYFPSYPEGKLRAETRTLALTAGDSDRIRQVALALVEGSQQESAAALGAGADLRAVFLTSDGTAYLDFSSAALAGLTPGIKSETLAVYSIVDSLAANVAAVKRVKILVQGQEVDTLDGHVDLTNDFVPDLTRIATPTP